MFSAVFLWFSEVQRGQKTLGVLVSFPWFLPKTPKLNFSNYLADYSYSFQLSFELFQLQFPCSFRQNAVTEKNSPLEFPRLLWNYSHMIQRFLN